MWGKQELLKNKNKRLNVYLFYNPSGRAKIFPTGLRINNAKMENFNFSQKAKKKVAYINNPLLTIYELVLRVL